MKAYRGRRGTHKIEGWVILRAGMDVFLEKRKSLAVTGIRTADSLARSKVAIKATLFRFTFYCSHFQ
jgi:hypothetical protein